MFWLFGLFLASNAGSPTRSSAASSGSSRIVVPPEESEKTEVLAELKRRVDEFERFDPRRGQEALDKKYLAVLAYAEVHKLKTHEFVDYMDAVRRYHVTRPPQRPQPEVSSSVAPYQLAGSH